MRHRSPDPIRDPAWADPVPADPFEAHRSRGALDAEQAPAITASLEAATVAVART